MNVASANSQAQHEQVFNFACRGGASWLQSRCGRGFPAFYLGAALLMERRLSAILAADVVGYSRLMGANEVATLQDLQRLHAELVEPEIGRHGGRVVKLTGDGILVEFSSVVGAVECAVAIQRSIP